MNMAQIYICEGKFEKGLEILGKAAAIKSNAKLFYRRGVCYMRLSEFDRAREDFSKVVEL